MAFLADRHEAPRIDLGRRGSRLDFTIAGELARLHVGPEGKILFYFVSW